MVDCLTPGCRQVLPGSTLIGTDVVPLTRVVSTDCVRNLIYVTDDPGLLTTDTEGLALWGIGTEYGKGDIVVYNGIAYESLVDTNIGNQPDTSPASWSSTYLDTSTRYQLISSFSQVSDHYLECEGGINSSIYRDLNRFFQIGSGTGKSPGYLLTVFWDREGGETLAEALDDFYKCFRCWELITLPTFLSDGTAVYDTSLQKDLENWAVINDNKVPVQLTFDPVLKLSFTETTSQAAQANALSYDYAHYVWAGELCEEDVNANCDGLGAQSVVVSPSHLIYAAILASYSSSDTTYIPDPFFRGPTGIAGEPIADLDTTETVNVTGTSRQLGGQIAEATRYVNVYHSVNGRQGFLYGTSVTGFFSYDLLQAKYIKREVESALLDALYNTTNRGISESQLNNIVETQIIALITKYEGQGIITTDEQDFEDRVPDGYVTVATGSGWVLAREPVSNLTAAELSQGFSPRYFFCYVNLRQLRFLSITICSLLKPEQISGVI